MPMLSQVDVIFWAVSLLFVVVTAVLLYITATIRGKYRAIGAVTYTRSPVGLILCTAVIVLGCGIAPFVGVAQGSGLGATLFVAAIFGLIFYAGCFQASLATFAADQQGLTYQLLAFKRALPWNMIDWVYPETKRTTVKAYGLVKVGSSTEKSLMIEAGAQRRMKIVLSGWVIKGDSAPLIAAVEQRATRAQFGFDKMPLVTHQRMSGGVPARW